jgi:uncharacterized LabA/DUF88 family protein
MPLIRLFPRITPEQNLIFQCYSFIHILNKVKGKHSFIPSYAVQGWDIREVASNQNEFHMPLESGIMAKNYFAIGSYSEKVQHKLISLIEIEGELSKDKKTMNQSPLNQLNLRDYSQQVYQLAESIDQHIVSSTDRVSIPTVTFHQEFIYMMKDIQNAPQNYRKWLLQLTDFFDFLTKEKIIVDESLTMEHFLFDVHGHIQCFTAFDHLKITKQSESVVQEKNMLQLQELIASFYYSSTIYQYDPTIERVYGKLSPCSYESFHQIKLDIQGQLVKKAAERKIGVFIDYANVFKGVDPLRVGAQVDFNRLLSRVYGPELVRRISVKYGVIFKPMFENNEQKNREENDKCESRKKDFFQKYGIHLEIVENGTPKAKQFINGDEKDIDDLTLVEKMKQNLLILDDILLLSGDKHFIPIVQEFNKKKQSPQKEKIEEAKVRVISLAEDTSEELKQVVDHYQCLTDYWDCILYET